MSGGLTSAANALWYLLCLPDSIAFRRATGDVANTQERLLRRLLRRNADTEFGRRHGFAAIRSVADYRAGVPLSTHDDYRDAVRRIGEGRAGVLTAEPVLLLEVTSGSSAPSKLIPYTAALTAEFERAVAPWIEDLYRHRPGLVRGQAYWSVTPVARRNERTPGGLPIGFEEDSEYFGLLRRALIRSVQAVPPDVRLIDDIDAFRYVTLLFLLRSRSLALISVWNPSFLSLLVAPLAEWWPRLADDTAVGTISPPAPIEPEVLARLRALVRPDRGRGAEIEAAFRAGNRPGAVHARLWPRLRLVSCWADAHAARAVPELARLFPHARIQGKGLLATEGVVSFPLVGRAGAALAIRSHFFEFLPVTGPGEGDGQAPRLAHEVDVGGRYEVVITTGGGLYRYRLHDLVRVVGRIGTCPLIRFIGKAAQISDRFGEKLNERHVRQALDTLFDRQALRPSFAMLAWEAGGSAWPASYTLFIEAADRSDEAVAALGPQLDAALRQNYHYRYCRDLGQLGAVRVFRVEGDAHETYLATCRERGQRIGAVKAVALHHLDGWSHLFRGRLLPAAPSEREPER